MQIYEIGGSGACGTTSAFLEDAIGFPDKREKITVEVGLNIIGELLKRKIPAIRIDISKTHSFVVFQYGNEIEIV